MKKILIWLSALTAGIVVLLLAAVLVIPRFIDVQKYQPIIERKVTEATGREFVLGDDADISVFPWVGVSFNNLRMANPQMYGGGDFIRVGAFQARVKLLPLLSKNIEIDTFVLKNPELKLVRTADGRVNWELAEKEKPPAAAQERVQEKKKPGQGSSFDLPLNSLDIEQVEVSGGRVLYVDETRKLSREIEDISLRLGDVSLENPIDISFQASLAGKPLLVEGSLGPIGREPGRGTIPVNLTVDAVQELVLKLNGEVVNPAVKPEFSLKMQAEEFSPRRLFEALQMPLPVETADPAVLNRMTFDLRARGDSSSIHVEESTVALDDSSLKINAVVKDMARPHVSFQLDLDSLDIDRYLPPEAENRQETAADADVPAPQTPAGKGGSAQPAGGEASRQSADFDYRPLRELVLEGRAGIGKLTAHGAKIENISLKITGRDGIFDLEALRMDTYQGLIEVNGKASFEQDSPQGNVAVKVENILVGPLLQDTLQKNVLEGAMSADADIRFAGGTAREITKSLNGTGRLMFADGALVGMDIAEIARSLAAGAGYQKPKEKPRTDFAELRVPFSLENGIFKTRDAALLSPLLRVQAAGSADLVRETLDMKVRPKVVGTLKGQGDEAQRSGLPVPLHIGGTFAKPRYSIDLSGIADREALEEAVRDPESAKEKLKSLEESGKSLLEGLGIRKKK